MFRNEKKNTILLIKCWNKQYPDLFYIVQLLFVLYIAVVFFMIVFEFSTNKTGFQSRVLFQSNKMFELC